ncbi:MAG TPA: M13 family peptidase, partial [Cyclobacteriaceae bacterium]|nr:M13 family peptidase [Cyclobacteriaceae bacterium]
MKNALYFLSLSLIIAACSTNKPEDQTEEVHALDLSNMDSTVRPQDDFFRYVNGGWINRTDIPSDLGSWGSFNELNEHNNATMLEILKNAGQNPAYTEGTDQRKAADFFSIGMDSTLAEKAGVNPLTATLKKIGAIKNK